MDVNTDIKKAVNIAIDIAIAQKQIKKIDIANIMRIAPNNFHNILARSDYKIGQLREIVGAIGYDLDIRLIDRETGKIIDVE